MYTCTLLHGMYMYMNNQSLRLGKVKQLRLKTTPFFSREEELPRAVHVRVQCTCGCVTVKVLQ